MRVNLMSTDHAMELVMEDTNVVQHPVHVMLVRETVTVILIVKEILCVDQTIAKLNQITILIQHQIVVNQVHTGCPKKNTSEI